MHPPYQPVAGVRRGVNSAVCWLLLQHRTYLRDGAVMRGGDMGIVLWAHWKARSGLPISVN